MAHPFDEPQFAALWKCADEALQLRLRTQAVLKERSLSTFDGFGHLLDFVLPRDSNQIRQLADILHVSMGHLSNLRAGSLDPLNMPEESLVLLGRVTGLEYEAFRTLVLQDHGRFARLPIASSRAVTARTGSAKLDALPAVWERFAADEAGDL